MRPGLAVLGLLAACAAPAVTPVTPSGFRDASAVIGSQTDATADDLAGDWVVRGAFADDGIGLDDDLRFAAAGRDLALSWVENGCGSPACPEGAYAARYAAGLAGRWRRSDVDPAGYVPRRAPSDIWVFWIDGDRRTLAMGAPDGSYALILDRARTGGADRIAAAREILDWYGFDTGRLVLR